MFGHFRMWPLLCLAVSTVVTLIHANPHDNFKKHNRYKRQIEESLDRTIDLNVSVPYIFSARLYPYGETNGDLPIAGPTEPYRLENPFHFLGGIYDTIYIREDGAIGLSHVSTEASPLPSAEPIIAVYWMPTKNARVYYRETNDANTVNLAHNEVNIQYRYGSKFRVKSVVVVTWEGGKYQQETNDNDGNVFQMAIIIGDEMSFAHIIYSRLISHGGAVAGFSGFNNSYSLPDSATSDVRLLAEKSDIGIPGEWLFRVDQEQVFLCGAGFKGLECIESCAPSQWSNDCYHSCHCDGGDACDHETGRCPNAKCSPGWRGEPICDKDIDECATDVAVCPSEQPDCLNTPGSFLCLCFEYDESTKRCKGSPMSANSSPIEVNSLNIPVVMGGGPIVTARQHSGQSRMTTHKEITTTRRQQTTTERTTVEIEVVTSSAKPSTVAVVTSSEAVPVDIDFPSGKHNPCAHCDKHAHCLNTQCTCDAGWQGDGLSCFDVDECQLSATCGLHSICRNTAGSFDCECQRGFIYLNETCIDIDECVNAPCGHAAGVECRNLVGTYECSCKDGFTGNPTQGCTDINECQIGVSCGPSAVCSNTIGGFECTCEEGFERLSDAAPCTDINECEVDPCHSAAVCTNTKGSFDCKCIDGFNGDGVHCHETILYPIANDSTVIARSHNAFAAIPLPQSIVLFGARYNTAYVSSNGYVSFSRYLGPIVSRPENERDPVLYGLHVQYDYQREGLVAYTYVNESDSAAYSLLARSALSAQTQFGHHGFHTKRLHIFTFDGMRQEGSQNLNSFQIVLAESEAGTIVSMIYQKAESRGPIVGVSGPFGFYSLPNDVISSQSNVDRPGKWMLQIDNQLKACPAGRTNAPLCDRDCSIGHWGFGCSSRCHCAGGVPCDFVSGICVTAKCESGWTGVHCDEDVNECELGTVTCGSNSVCINSPGAFECQCDTGYVTDGSKCIDVLSCEAFHGRSCASNAKCSHTNGEARCLCNPGYEGDGFRCTPATLPIIDIGKEILLPNLNELAVSDAEVEKDVGEKPFVMKEWSTERVVTTTSRIATLITGSHTTKSPITDATDHHISNNSENTDTNEAKPTVLVYIVAAACFGFIWIVLVVIYCTVRKHKKTREVAKQAYESNVWSAPTRRTTIIPVQRIPSGNNNFAYGRHVPYLEY